MTDKVPLRVDLAGPTKRALDGIPIPRDIRVINCAIAPLVDLTDWPFQKDSGLGDEAALTALGQRVWSSTYWPDLGVIEETGLCVWQLDNAPVLEFKMNGYKLLAGRMALWHSGKPCGCHIDHSPLSLHRPSAALADQAVREGSLTKLAEAVNQSHNLQLADGMEPLPSALHSIAYKYVGGGYGGYALYLFADQEHRDAFCTRPDTLAIEPYYASIMA